MFDTPITIILPVKHYVPRYLKAAIQSVLDQSSGDWRLILVADNSVVSELKSFLQGEFSNSRFQFVVGMPNLAARINVGMKQASTEFVTLLLGDDLFAANAIEVLHRAIRARSLRSISSIPPGGLSTAKATPSVRYMQAAVRFEWKDFLNGSPVKHLLCWRREMALAIGGVDECIFMSGPDDYDFPWSMFERGAKFQALPECLYICRNHCDGFRLTTHEPRTVQLLCRPQNSSEARHRFLAKLDDGVRQIAKRPGEPINLRQPPSPMVLPPCRV